MKKFVSLQTDMRKIAVLTISLMVMLMASCGQKKKDAAYYEMMVDSIRKAEQVRSPLPAVLLYISRILFSP